MQHGLVCTDGSLLVFAALQLELGLEGFAFARGQLEFDGGDHFAGTFTGTEIADGELASIGPIGVDGRSTSCGGISIRFSSIRLDSALPIRLINDWKDSSSVRSATNRPSNPIDRFRDSLGGYRANRQAIGSGVFCPLAAKDDLEMRNVVSVLVATDTVKAKVGDVVLPAGIEAAADLDPQILTAGVDAAILLDEVARRSSPARPREEEIPSLQVSVPGHEQTSVIVPRPGHRVSASRNSS